MKLSLIPALVAGLLSAGPALSNVLIDFDGPTSFESIDQYYNGGTDSAGASGADLRVAFGADALAVQNDALGPYFSNAPSPLGIMAPVGADATLNFAPGIFGFASVYYSSLVDVMVGLYSDLDGAGTLLGSFNLTGNAQDGCADSDFCNWSLASLDFNGVARSITFGDAAYVAGFDNLTLKPIPEPGSLALLALGLTAGVLTRAGRGKRSPR